MDIVVNFILSGWTCNHKVVGFSSFYCVWLKKLYRPCTRTFICNLTPVALRLSTAEKTFVLSHWGSFLLKCYCISFYW